MESNSKENRIHCSKSSAELLEVQYPELPLRPRGRIAIKGKGRMETFWVDEDGEGRRASDVQQELEDMRLSLEKKAELAKLEALVEESSEFEQSESFSAREDKIDIEAPPARAVETGFVEADPEQPLKKTSRSFPHAAPKRVPEHSSETTQEQGLKERLTLYLSNNTNGQSHGDFYFQ